MRPLPTLFALGALLAAPLAPAEAVVPGQPAPNFELLTPAGAPHRLADLRGRLVLLAFIGYG